MNQFLKILSVFLTCSFAFKIGFPTTFMVLDQNFMKVILISCGGGIFGNILFTYLSAAILKSIHNFRVKRGLIHKKKVFNSFNRRVIRVKKKFGLAGIAFITPIFLSTPIGAFLAERFFRDKKKIILYLSAATIFWAFALYFILYFFHEGLKGWLI
jgi:hypothetical protein